jgi:hypothetical protein
VASKAQLDFDITCPIIDGELEVIENVIWDHLNGTECEHLMDKLFKDIKPHLERVRQTNIDMRKAADSQISDLQDEIDGLISDLEDRKREYEAGERHLHETIDLMAGEMADNDIESQYHTVRAGHRIRTR